MFQKILLATDGSEHSIKAEDYALQLAKMNTSQVEIFYVIPLEKSYWPGAYGVPGIDSPGEDPAMEEGKRIIAKVAEKFDEAGIKYTTKIKNGNPANEICNEAEENEIEIIIIGNQGINTLERLSHYIPESVSKRVVAHASCPVIVVR